MRKNSSSYPVEVVEDVFSEESPVLAKLLEGASRVLLVADMNVVQRTPGLGTKIGRYVKAHGIALAGNPVVLAGGERLKDNFQTATNLASSVVAAKLGANDVVLALGGGTLFDVVGWVAAQARGGTRVVRIPTTPIAMLDAAFSTRSFINVSSVKNAMGVACVPSSVVVDTSFANTVLEGVWRSGMGEAVRLAAASDAALLKKLEKQAADYAVRKEGTLDALVKVVHATRAKKGGTELGLWSAHRLQSMSGYKLPHGHAVVIALVIEAFVGVERGVLKEDDVTRILDVLKACGTLDGMYHSQHLINQTDNLLHGLDAWFLHSPDGIPALAGIGKTETLAEIDRDLYRRAVKRAATLSLSLGAKTAPEAKPEDPANAVKFEEKTSAEAEGSEPSDASKEPSSDIEPESAE